MMFTVQRFGKWLCLYVLTLSAAHAQSAYVSRNSLLMEVGGNGMFGSINFERHITKTPLVSVRAGLGYYRQGGRSFITVPVGANLLLRLKKHPNWFADLGLGMTYSPHNSFLFGDSGTPLTPYTLAFVPSLGLRYYARSGTMFRVSITPLHDKYDRQAWFGAAIGLPLN